MLILTPSEVTAFRAVYMHSLAVALIDGNIRHWQSATDEERAEVRKMLTGWHKLPDEKKQISDWALQEKAARLAEAAREAIKNMTAGKSASASQEKEKPSA